MIAAYDRATGRIVQMMLGGDVATFCTAQGWGHLEATSGETDATHYVSGGALVAFPGKPSAQHAWDWATKTWVDPRTLGDLKAAKWTEIKAARDAMEFGGFAWDGSTFDSDAISQSRIQGAAQLATLAMLNSQPFSIDWTLADNAVRTMGGADMIAAGQAMGVHIAAAHEIGRQLRAQIDAAMSAADLESVQWPT